MSLLRLGDDRRLIVAGLIFTPLRAGGHVVELRSELVVALGHLFASLWPWPSNSGLTTRVRGKGQVASSVLTQLVKSLELVSKRASTRPLLGYILSKCYSHVPPGTCSA